ncbi:centrosomal protein of 290 kDa-like [Sarcophilus harrisii]
METFINNSNRNWHLYRIFSRGFMYTPLLGYQSGRSGKTIPELEKIVGLMKKVVDKVQKENEYLKQASGIMTSEKMSALELENKNLKSELEKLKLHLGRQLSLQYEFNAKGPENIMVESDSLFVKNLKKTMNIWTCHQFKL